MWFLFPIVLSSASDTRLWKVLTESFKVSVFKKSSLLILRNYMWLLGTCKDSVLFISNFLLPYWQSEHLAFSIRNDRSSFATPEDSMHVLQNGRYFYIQHESSVHCLSNDSWFSQSISQFSTFSIEWLILWYFLRRFEIFHIMHWCFFYSIWMFNSLITEWRIVQWTLWSFSMVNTKRSFAPHATL